MPKVTEVKKAYPIFKKDMKKYQDRSSTRDEIRKLKRKSTGEHSASKLNRFCIGMFSKDGLYFTNRPIDFGFSCIVENNHCWLRWIFF